MNLDKVVAAGKCRKTRAKNTLRSYTKIFISLETKAGKVLPLSVS